MKKRLSALAVPKLGAGEYWDVLIPGLCLRVGARRRTWTMRHRIGDRHRRDVLGYFPAMSLAEARTAASRLIERFEGGAAPPPPPVHPRSALTLGALIDRYEVLRRKEGHRIKYLDGSMKALRRGLANYLNLPAAQFSKADLRAARDAIAERGLDRQPTDCSATSGRLCAGPRRRTWSRPTSCAICGARRSASAAAC